MTPAPRAAHWKSPGFADHRTGEPAHDQPDGEHRRRGTRWCLGEFVVDQFGDRKDAQDHHGHEVAYPGGPVFLHIEPGQEDRPGDRGGSRQGSQSGDDTDQQSQ